MKFMLCEKQFLDLNIDADADVNAEMSLPRFPSGQNKLLQNFFLRFGILELRNRVTKPSYGK